jgi:hypothetical protein
MNEGKLREEVERGNKAEQLLKNEIFTETFDVLHQRYIDELVSTKSDESEKRERLYNAVTSLQHVKAHIESVATTGTMAAQQINEMFKRR